MKIKYIILTPPAKEETLESEDHTDNWWTVFDSNRETFNNIPAFDSYEEALKLVKEQNLLWPNQLDTYRIAAIWDEE